MAARQRRMRGPGLAIALILLAGPAFAQIAPGPLRLPATALEQPCRRAAALKAVDRAKARAFFEDNFRPVRIARLGETQGFLTGYYEPIVDGSRMPTREFTVPMYRRPDDLISPGERKGETFPNRGPVFRRNGEGALVPYFDRGEIEDGA